MAAAEVAQAAIWAEIEASAYPTDVLPHEEPSALHTANMLNPVYLWPSMTHTSDVMPEGRLKLIHTYGSVAKVSFTPSKPSSFSGVFQTGGVGLARLSLARQTAPYAPGMGLKIFVDGSPSINFHAMYRLDGQGDDRNFFSHPFTNILSPAEAVPTKVLQATFKMSVDTVDSKAEGRPEGPGKLPLLEAARILADGGQVPPTEVKTPYRIIFEPTPEVQGLFAAHLEGDMRTALGSLPAGTVLYTVLLTASREPDAERHVAGTITTTSKFLASKFGDEKLFFQHMRHRDVAL